MEKGLRIPQKERTKTTNSILISLMNQLEKARAYIWVSSLLSSWIKQLLWLIFHFRSIYCMPLWWQPEKHFGCCVLVKRFKLSVQLVSVKIDCSINIDCRFCLDIFVFFFDNRYMLNYQYRIIGSVWMYVESSV